MVVADPTIAPDASQYVDPAFELFRSLSVQRVKTTNSFIVTLEGKDPAKTKKLLETLLIEFKKQAKEENESKVYSTESYAKDDLEKLKRSQLDLDKELQQALSKNRTIGAGGRSIVEEEYLSHTALMNQHQRKLRRIHQQMLAAQLFPKLDTDPHASAERAHRPAGTRSQEVHARARASQARHAGAASTTTRS